MKETYDEYLRWAEETLKLEYLTPDDRKLIKRGVWHLKTGYGLIKSEVPEDLRRAASLLMIGGYYLGAGCVVLRCGKKYWNLKDQGKGGSIAGKIKHDEAMIWKDWVRGEIARKNAKGEWLASYAARRIADDLKKRDRLPVLLPDRDRVARFISQTRKANAVSDKRKSIRLVHG